MRASGKGMRRDTFRYKVLRRALYRFSHSFSPMPSVSFPIVQYRATAHDRVLEEYACE